MMISKITSKHQTTIPKAVRKRLKLKVSDLIEWKLDGNRVIVLPVTQEFLKYKNSVVVGRGNIRRDIEQGLSMKLVDRLS